MRTNKIIDATVDELESAKQTVVSLTEKGSGVVDLFYSVDLEEVERGIRGLNEMAGKAWILSALLLYTKVYNNDMYLQSGLSWAEYSKRARDRLGMSERDVSEQLSAARFFIKNHGRLIKAGWTPSGSVRKLARAELALELSGSLEETIRHVAEDSWSEFNKWYSAYRTREIPQECGREDIEVDGFKIGGIEAVSVSERLPAKERKRMHEYIERIFEILKRGDEPAIIQVYDRKEARRLEVLRDRARGER